MIIDRKKLWHLLFLVGLFFKGLDGILEITGGLILLLLKQGTIVRYVSVFFRNELAEDRDDIVANYLIHLVAGLSQSTEFFAGIYLLGHGIVKAGIVTGLLLRKLWVYILAEIVLAIFIVYQLYRYSHTYSTVLLFLTIVDFFIIFLIWTEYKRLTSGELK
jgi:uncharacterized membrane protein